MTAAPPAKVIFFNRSFFPYPSATSQLLSDLAFHQASTASVHVVTSRLPAAAPASETIRGVSIHRISKAAGSRGLLPQGLAYSRYLLAAKQYVPTIVAPGDIVVLKSDPPMLSGFLGPSIKARGAKLVIWLQDMFPEVATEFGIPGLKGWAGDYLRRRRDHSLSMADAVVTIGEGMAEKVAGLKCVDSRRLHVIHNWADGDAIHPLARGGNALREAWGLGDRFVISYSGNFGRVHEFGTLLDTAARLRDDPGFAFLLVGEGPRLAEVRKRVEHEHLDNVVLRPLQERDSLLLSLNVGDLHVSVLRPQFEGLVVPSKLYGIMAAGKPTIFIGSDLGDTARILYNAGAGACIRVGDPEGLVRLVRRLREDNAARQLMGTRAREAFEARYDKRVALAAWSALFESLMQRGGNPA